MKRNRFPTTIFCLITLFLIVQVANAVTLIPLFDNRLDPPPWSIMMVPNAAGDHHNNINVDLLYISTGRTIKELDLLEEPTLPEINGNQWEVGALAASPGELVGTHSQIVDNLFNMDFGADEWALGNLNEILNVLGFSDVDIDYHTVYARINIKNHHTQDIKAGLYVVVHGNTSAKCWLNGSVVLSGAIATDNTIGGGSTVITLLPGDNDLLFKSSHALGEWNVLPFLEVGDDNLAAEIEPVATQASGTTQTGETLTISADAASLLEEFIGLHKPFEAVAGVAPPSDILDAADVSIIRANWDDIARGVEGYSEWLDVNSDGSVNERDLKLVEFALTLDINGDGTLSAQEMAYPPVNVNTVGVPDLVVESVRVSELGRNSRDKGLTVNPGDKFELYVSFKNQGTAISDQTRVLYYRVPHSSPDSSPVSKTLIGEGSKVSLSGNEVVQRKLTVTAPEIVDRYYYSVCVDSLSNEIQTANNCSSEDEVVSVTVKAGLPSWLIQSVAHSADGYTYFVVNPPPGIALPLEHYSLEALAEQLPEGISEHKALDYVTKCSVTLDTPDSGYFMFPLESPQGQKTAVEETTGDVAGAIEDTVSLGFSIIGNVPEAFVKEGSWLDKVKKGVGKAFSKITGLVKLAGVVIDIGIEIFAPDNSTADPTLTVEPKFNFWNILGAEILGNIGVENYEYTPFLPPMLFVIREDLSSIDVTVVQEYDVDGVSEYSWDATWNLKDNTGAAPSARPMSLADYPPFQQLPPEIQEVLLQYSEGTANLKATNAEMWQVPQETALLPNYPNPFNPETWIPYQLAKSAEVSISIYAVDGQLVRTLDLGHQPVGMYQGKSRAAHWDGRNAVGEPVASGVYFYTLTAGEFTATRKMLIKK